MKRTENYLNENYYSISVLVHTYLRAVNYVSSFSCIVYLQKPLRVRVF